MADSSYTVVQYTREEWTLADLRDLVDKTANLPAWCSVLLTAAQPDSAGGTVKVLRPVGADEIIEDDNEGDENETD